MPWGETRNRFNSNMNKIIIIITTIVADTKNGKGTRESQRSEDEKQFSFKIKDQRVSTMFDFYIAARCEL